MSGVKANRIIVLTPTVLGQHRPIPGLSAGTGTNASACPGRSPDSERGSASYLSAAHSDGDMIGISRFDHHDPIGHTWAAALAGRAPCFRCPRYPPVRNSTGGYSRDDFEFWAPKVLKVTTGDWLRFPRCGLRLCGRIAGRGLGRGWR